MIFFEYEQDKSSLTDRKLTAAMSLLVKQFVKQVADFALDSSRKHIPQGNTLRSLEALEIDGPHRGVDPGSWIANVGVGEITPKDQHESPDYPIFVHQGTGLFHEDESKAGLITAAQPGNVMVFEKLGEGTVFTRTVEGQLPQPWSEDVDRETNEYVRLHKRALAKKIEALFN